MPDYDIYQKIIDCVFADPIFLPKKMEDEPNDPVYIAYQRFCDLVDPKKDPPHPQTQTQIITGGRGGSKYVLYQSKRRKVYPPGFILWNKQKLYLKAIRGKYRYAPLHRKS